VHQVELKMQNDELLRVQAELDATRARYFDLYYLHRGYFIVSHEGSSWRPISPASICWHRPRRACQAADHPVHLQGRPGRYYLHRRKLLATGKASTCELRMVKPTGRHSGSTDGHHEQDPSTDSGRTPARAVSRVVLTDISEQKQLEQQDKDEVAVKVQRAKKSPRVDPEPERARVELGVALRGEEPNTKTTLACRSRPQRLHELWCYESTGRALSGGSPSPR